MTETQTPEAHKASCRCPTCWAAYMRAYRRRKNGRGRPAAFYASETEPVVVKLSPLAKQILDSSSRRVGRPARDVVERLLRESASQSITFESTEE